MPGPPSKYTPERSARVLQAIRGGSTNRDAAAYGGVDEDTLIRWRKRYAEFADAFTRAESECAVSMTAHLVKAAALDWRAALAWLERRRRDEWGKVDKIEVDFRQQAEAVAEALAAEGVTVTPDELARDYQRFKALAPGRN